MQNVCQNSPLQTPITKIPISLTEQLILIALLDTSLTATRVKVNLYTRANYRIKLTFIYTILDKLHKQGLINFYPSNNTKVFFITEEGEKVLEDVGKMIKAMKEGVEV